MDAPVPVPVIAEFMDIDSASKRTRYDSDSCQEMDEMKAFVDRVAIERDAYTRMKVMLTSCLDLGKVSSNSSRKVETAHEALTRAPSNEVQQALDACRLERQRFNATYEGFKSK